MSSGRSALRMHCWAIKVDEIEASNHPVHITWLNNPTCLNNLMSEESVLQSGCTVCSTPSGRQLPGMMPKRQYHLAQIGPQRTSRSFWIFWDDSRRFWSAKQSESISFPKASHWESLPSSTHDCEYNCSPKKLQIQQTKNNKNNFCARIARTLSF